MNQSTELYAQVEGMACAMCVRNVQNALMQIPGVESAAVSLENKSAQIRFDADKVSPEQLKNSVDALGYTLILPQE